MKTKLNITITNEAEAIEFLTELYENNEVYHPEDNAHDVLFETCEPSKRHRNDLNRLMDEIYTNTNIDPCEILLDIFYECESYFNVKEYGIQL